MYIENVDGFDGEGDLFTKFGVEIRDAATFIMSRRRWGNVIAINENSADTPFYRPREGDLIHLSLSNSTFEITKVEDESPFYQLKDLPTFRMRCELFEYNDEDMDTGIPAIDNIENAHAYQTILTFPLLTGDGFEIGEQVDQINSTYTMSGEVVRVDASDPNAILVYISHQGASDGQYHTWTTINAVTGASSETTGTPVSTGEDLQESSMNDDFDTVTQGGEIDFMDFSESNPFGDP